MFETNNSGKEMCLGGCGRVYCATLVGDPDELGAATIKRHADLEVLEGAEHNGFREKIDLTTHRKGQFNYLFFRGIRDMRFLVHFTKPIENSNFCFPEGFLNQQILPDIEVMEKFPDDIEEGYTNIETENLITLKVLLDSINLNDLAVVMGMNEAVLKRKSEKERNDQAYQADLDFRLLEDKVVFLQKKLQETITNNKTVLKSEQHACCELLCEQEEINSAEKQELLKTNKHLSEELLVATEHIASLERKSNNLVDTLGRSTEEIASLKNVLKSEQIVSRNVGSLKRQVHALVSIKKRLKVDEGELVNKNENLRSLMKEQSRMISMRENFLIDQMERACCIFLGELSTCQDQIIKMEEKVIFLSSELVPEISTNIFGKRVVELVINKKLAYVRRKESMQDIYMGRILKLTSQKDEIVPLQLQLVC